MKKMILFTSLLVLFVACKPSTKNETNKWGFNQEYIQTALTKYPSFSKHVVPLMVQAKSDWQKAEALSDEEAKAKAMKAVNQQFSTGILNKLTQVIVKNKSIDDSINSLSKKRIAKKVISRVNRKISAARSNQSAANRLMLSADVSTLETATESTQAAISKLIAGISDANSAKKLSKKKK